MNTTDNSTHATTTTVFVSPARETESATSHVPFLCVEAEAIMEYAIMGAAFALFLGILIIVLCLVCRQRARREQYYTERLKAQLRAQHDAEAEHLDKLEEAAEEEEEVVGLELQTPVIFQQHGDYSELTE